jgi:hypothetical protein
MSAPAGDRPARDTMREVARIRERAAAGPTADTLAELLADVSRQRPDLTAKEVRALGALAIRQANEVNYLLGCLAGLLEEVDEGNEGGG